MSHSCEKHMDYNLDTAKFVDAKIIEVEGECIECGNSLEGTFTLEILKDDDDWRYY